MYLGELLEHNSFYSIKLQHFHLLVSFSGKYLKYEHCVASTHNWTEDKLSSAFNNQLYKMCVPHTETNLFGPAFTEVGIDQHFYFLNYMLSCMFKLYAAKPPWSQYEEVSNSCQCGTYVHTSVQPDPVPSRPGLNQTRTKSDSFGSRVGFGFKELVQPTFKVG